MGKHKYIARVPANNGEQKWRYFYSNQEYQAYLQGKNQTAQQNSPSYKLGKSLYENRDKIKSDVKKAANTAKDVAKKSWDANQALQERNQQYQEQQIVKNPAFKVAKINEKIASDKAALAKRQEQIALNKEASRRHKTAEAFKTAVMNTDDYKIHRYETEQKEKAEKKAKADAYIALRKRLDTRPQYDKEQAANKKAKADDEKMLRRMANNPDSLSKAHERQETLNRINDPDYDKKKAQKKKEEAVIAFRKRQERSLKEQNAAREEKEKNPIERGKKVVSKAIAKTKKKKKTIEKSISKAATDAKKKASEIAVDVKSEVRDTVNTIKNKTELRKKKKKRR